MIKGVTEILPGVLIYENGYQGEELIQNLTAEANRPWSYLPFYLGNGDLNYCESFYCPIGHILKINPAEPVLKKIKSQTMEVNELLEIFLRDYSLYYSNKFKRDGGLNFFQFVRNSFSAQLESPSTGFCTTALVTLNNIRIRLERHNVEFEVAAGDGIIMPSGFPFDVRIQPIEEQAFVFNKYLWPR